MAPSVSLPFTPEDEGAQMEELEKLNWNAWLRECDIEESEEPQIRQLMDIIMSRTIVASYWSGEDIPLRKVLEATSSTFDKTIYETFIWWVEDPGQRHARNFNLAKELLAACKWIKDVSNQTSSKTLKEIEVAAAAAMLKRWSQNCVL